ncbi:unnamed protein product, partial [Didymodactylos carnosus]
AEAAKPSDTPVQCQQCFKFGHPREYCREIQDICRKCGGNHTTNNCTANGAKCLNCSDQHEANSTLCLKYIEQQQKIRKIIDDYTSEIKVPAPMTTINFPSLTKTYHSAHQHHQADEYL